MIRRIAFLFCFLFLFIPGQVFPLSESDYKAMLKDSAEFRKADKELNSCWNKVYGGLEGDYKKHVLNGQRQWMKIGWDETAQKYINKGMSKPAAYAKAIQNRINQLLAIQGNNSLDGAPPGSVKADDYSNPPEEGAEQQTNSPFSNEDSAYKIAEEVIIATSDKSIPQILEMSDKAFQLSQNEKDASTRDMSKILSWFFAVRAATLFSEADDKSGETGKLVKKQIYKALNRSLSDFGIGKGKRNDFFDKCAEIIRVAGDRVASETEKEELQDDFALPDDRKLPIDRKRPKKSSRGGMLASQNYDAQNKLIDALEAIEPVKAKVQNPSGKAYPILQVLSRSKSEYGNFDKELGQAMMEKSGGKRINSPKQILDVMNSAWDSIGYSMEATCYQLFKTITPRQYFYATGHGIMDLCIPIIQFFKDDKLLKSAIENGYIAKDTAIEYIDASLRYYKALEKVDNDGARLPD